MYYYPMFFFADVKPLLYLPIQVSTEELDKLMANLLPADTSFRSHTSPKLIMTNTGWGKLINKARDFEIL